MLILYNVLTIFFLGLTGIASSYNEHRDNGLRECDEIISFVENFEFPSAEIDYDLYIYNAEEGKEEFGGMGRESYQYHSDDDVFADIPPIPRNVSLYEADSGESEEVGYAERTGSRNSYEVIIVSPIFLQKKNRSISRHFSLIFFQKQIE